MNTAKTLVGMIGRKNIRILRRQLAMLVDASDNSCRVRTLKEKLRDPQVIATLRSKLGLEPDSSLETLSEAALERARQLHECDAYNIPTEGINLPSSEVYSKSMFTLMGI